MLFWISGALTSFCLSYYLQKKIDSDFFAIIDAYDKPRVFFENQNLVTFEKTWFYHDFFKNIKKPDLKYLSNFEKKYDINLWNLVINERIFYRFNSIYKFSNDEILSILEHECKFFEKILSDVKPDFLIMFESYYLYRIYTILITLYLFDAILLIISRKIVYNKLPILLIKALFLPLRVILRIGSISEILNSEYSLVSIIGVLKLSI